jgi:hypothetical protein
MFWGTRSVKLHPPPLVILLYPLQLMQNNGPNTPRIVITRGTTTTTEFLLPILSCSTYFQGKVASCSTKHAFERAYLVYVSAASEHGILCILGLEFDEKSKSERSGMVRADLGFWAEWSNGRES